MKSLIEKVEQWHWDRNLIDGATDKDQVLKLIQEVGELSDNVCKQQDVADDIGDCLVILINIAVRNGLHRHLLQQSPELFRRYTFKISFVSISVSSVVEF